MLNLKGSGSRRFEQWVRRHLKYACQEEVWKLIILASKGQRVLKQCKSVYFDMLISKINRSEIFDKPHGSRFEIQNGGQNTNCLFYKVDDLYSNFTGENKTRSVQ